MDEQALADAREALHHWDIEPTQIDYLTRTENVVFRVHAAYGKKYVLRLHRPGYHNFDELVSEQIWTRALLDAGNDVPVAVPTSTGAGYAEARFNGEMRYAGVLEWVDGEDLRTLMADETDAESLAVGFAQLGTTLAQLHNQASTWLPPEGFTRHAFDVDGLMGDEPFWGRFWESKDMAPDQRDWLSQARHRVREALLSCPKTTASYSLIHADVHPGNLIINGPRVHVIDFDDAGFGWHQYDLAIALFHHRDNNDYQTFHDSLIDAYRQVRTIDDNVLRYLPLFSIARALATIGWLSARPEHDEDSDALEMYDYATHNLDSALEQCKP